MEGKRKRASRTSARLEQPSKKRNSTPPEPSPSSTPPVDPLPTAFAPGQTLPTVPEPQPEHLAHHEFQSVEESGVLADSLKRSRQKLLYEDGIFERYWKKPTKKKGISYEEPNNPPKDSMTKLGPCTITIEPHVFEAVMYSVKEPARPEPTPFRPPIIQYGPPQGVMPKAPEPPTSAPAAPPADPAKGADPMIQMLAEIAGKNEDFKTLMKLVAVGEASPEQLSQFQARIEELNRLVEKRPPAPAARSAPQPQALRSKGPVGPAKPDISAVVFEFAGGSGDRFLFPKFSVLELLPGGSGQVVASFLIVRRGSQSDAPTYDPQLDYYQPVTIRIYARTQRQLEALLKAVAPPDEVRRYMDDVMDHVTRAEYVLLAMRLPREAPQTPDDDAPGPDHQVLWTATADPPPVAAAKKPLDEQAQYHAFVASVR